MNTMAKKEQQKKYDSFKTDDMVLEGDGQSILINGRRFRLTVLDSPFDNKKAQTDKE